MAGFSAVTYALSKKYTNETAIQFGGLKGAPCKVKSVVKKDGQNIITLEWKNDDGDTRETQFAVDDGTPIYTWEPNKHFEYGDLAIYASCFYRCIIPNADSTFIESHWNAIGTPDGNYDLVETASELPVRFTSADRKMYYVIDESIFYLWDGTDWVPQNPNVISNNDIDALFGF